MLRNTTISLTIWLLALILSGCAVKKMGKQAFELEKAGMFKEAAELYYRAALRKPNNVDFKTGLRRASMMYVEDVSQSLNNSFSRGEYQKVVYDFHELDAFVNRISRTGVDVQIDPSTRRIYDNAQGQYLDTRYDEGMRFLGEERYDEAKTVFSEIFKINPDFKDTRKNLNIATLEPIYQSGTAFFSQRNYMSAYNEWKKVATADPNYKDARQRMQQALGERYREGTISLMNEDFAAAAQALGEVFRANPGYQDVRVLFTEARNEPIYRGAVESLKKNRCREAYMAFSGIIEDAGGDYRDSRSLRTQALDCASYPVAILTNPMPTHGADGRDFEGSLMQSILNKKDPFVKIHTLPSIDSRIHRSLVGATGSLNRTLLRDLHDRHGIKAVLIVSFAQYDKTQGRREKVEKTGFLREKITTEQGDVSYRDSEVKYVEYSQRNQVSLSLHYQLVATQNGEVLMSQRLNSNEQSFMNFAEFDGDAKNLYPAMLRNNNYLIDERNFSSLQRLLSADKGLAPVEKLRETVFVDLTSKIADGLVKFNPER
jgi:tetratricopeptide (TPR) repeat protein